MSKIKGFYSAVDKAAKELTRAKGTGKEFMVEVAKTKGVKPTEIKERKLQSIADLPKMSKDEFIKELEKNPPPTLKETVIGEPTDSEVREIAEQFMHDDAIEEVGMTKRNRHELEDEVDSVFEDKMENEMDRYMSLARQYIMDQGEGTKYPDYKTEGGQNYREILMRLPSDTAKNQERLYELEAKERRSSVGRNFGNITPEEVEELNQLRERIKTAPEDYKSKHWDEPNVLAHMRVQDRVVPTYTKAQIEDIGKRMAETLGVDPKNLASGAPSVAVQRGVITPLEAAQFSHAKGFKNVDTTGATQKILHVEEIQSDWHQEGREKGYKQGLTPEQKQEMQALLQKHADEDGLLWNDNNRLTELIELENKGVPDAPFKKNWHELAMKRLLNYAVENGYDKIAVTPGEEQAKRYNLSKHISGIDYIRNELKPQRNEMIAYDPKGNVIFNEFGMTPEKLEQHIGKEVAQKLLSQEAQPNQYGLPTHSLRNEELVVGGEGMKGFYDKMIPSYLNEFGKKYGTQVTPFDIEHPTANPEATDVIMQKMPLHGFDITPQMREEITTQGLPMFADGGVVKASVGGEYDTDPDMQDGGNVIQGTAFKKGGKVTVSNNPDTMLMDVHDKKFGKGGALKKAIKGAQEILPSAEREENLRKMLDSSKIKERLYHATPKSFSEFKPGGVDPTVSGKAIWMSTDPERQPAAHNIHNYFKSAGPYKEGVNVMPVHVQAKNPLVLDDPTMIEWAREVFAGGSNEFPELLAPQWIDEVRKEGYDSIQFADPYDRGDVHEVIMFEPSKIKSAIGNRGTYDVTNPDITKHNGGLAQIQRK